MAIAKCLVDYGLTLNPSETNQYSKGKYYKMNEIMNYIEIHKNENNNNNNNKRKHINDNNNNKNKKKLKNNRNNKKEKKKKKKMKRKKDEEIITIRFFV